MIQRKVLAMKSSTVAATALLVMTAAVFTEFGCTSPSMQPDVTEAMRASEEFHSCIASSDYGAIYDKSSNDFKASVSRAQFVVALTDNTARMKNCTKPELLLTSYHLTGKEQVDLTYRRTCEQGRESREKLSWSFFDGKAILSDYAVDDTRISGK